MAPSMPVNTTRVSLKASLKRFFEDLRSKVMDTKPRELQTRQQISVWNKYFRAIACWQELCAFVLKLANASMAAFENSFRGQTKVCPACLQNLCKLALHAYNDVLLESWSQCCT